MRQIRYLILIAILSVVAGCASQSATDTGAAGAADDSGARTTGIDDGGMQAGAVIAPDGDLNLVDDRQIYFEFNRATIAEQYQPLIRMHGRNLADNPDISMRVEGNADERGTREYNIGLGERRAQAVKAALMVQGASASQLTTVSYGEERPVATGSNETAWARNRRVDMVYGG